MPTILDGQTNGFFCCCSMKRMMQETEGKKIIIVLNNLSSVRSWHKYFNVYSPCGVVVEG